jgi:hypothetical protein
VLPFTSINVSELSVWTPSVDNTSYVSVTSDAFYTQSGTDPVRGKTVPQTAVIPAGAQTATAFTKMRKSNSALAAVALPIDKDEDGLDNVSGLATSTELDSDSQAFAIPAAGGGGGTAGTFTIAPTGYGSKDPSFTGGNVTNCTSAKVSGKTVYTCSSSKIGSADTLTVSNYNVQSANPSNAPNGTSITCTKSDGTAPLTSSIVNTDPKLYVCSNYPVSSVTSSNAAATVTTPFTVLSSGLLGESTQFLVTPINQDDKLTVNFAAETSTYGYSCTYTTTISDRKVFLANCK